MVLPGVKAKEVRKKAADILTRYFAGDPSLAAEIEANAESNAPINQLARASLGKRDAEVAELDIERVKSEITERKAKALAMNVASYNEMMKMYTSLCPAQVLDDRAQTMFRDTIMNLAFQGTPQKAITNGQDPNTPSLLTVSELACGLGIRFKPGEMSELGKAVKKWYRKEYEESPPTALKFVNGHNTQIAAYPERDWPAINDMIRDFE